MEFALPYSLTKIPNATGIISFAINYNKGFLACLTEESILLYDNSSFYPILITSFSQFFESFNINGPNNWIEWITDEDLAFVTSSGVVYISHVVILERKQLIHDYDKDSDKKYLNRFELIKILAPISVSVFNGSPKQSDSPNSITSVFTAYNYVCVCTSESKVICINKDAEIVHALTLFSKPTHITNAGFYPPASLLCLVDTEVKIFNFDKPTLENKVKPIVDNMPIKHASIMALNNRHTYLAVFKPSKGSLRIYQMGLPEWKPPITVYAKRQGTQQQSSNQNSINSIEDPVIHLFWSSKGNSLIIIHKSGKVFVFVIETKTIHQTQIDYFSQKTEEAQSQLQQASSNDKNADSNEISEQVIAKSRDLDNKLQYCFLYDSFGERLFVSNGKSFVFITILQNKDFFLYTSGSIIDLRRNFSLYNSCDLYPIKNILLDVRNSILLVSNNKGIQLLDSNNGKFVSNFVPVVSEQNLKNRCILSAHFIGQNQICVVVGPSQKFGSDVFELNFTEKRSESIECDCDNAFYSQFDNCYLYNDINKEIEKEEKKEFFSPKIDDGEIRCLFVFLSFNLKDDTKDENDFKYEIKPDLLIQSFFIPEYFDFIESRGILSDHTNIAYITLLNKLEEPNKFNKYYLAKSNNIVAIRIAKISNNFQIRGLAMSTAETARFLLSNGYILDEKLEQFGNNMFLTSSKMSIEFDYLLSTKNPPFIYYIYSTRSIEGSNYKYAFYQASPIFSCLDYFMRYSEIPFAFDGMVFYVLPANNKFGSFNFRFVNIGQHVLIDAINDYTKTIYLINFVYRKFNQIPVVICETFKEALAEDSLPKFLLYIIPHLKLEEISQIIQYLPTRVDKQTFSLIFDSLFNYISYSNKYYTDTNKKYMVVTVNYESFSSKIIELKWDKIFSLIEKNIRNQIFLNISSNIFPKLIDEMELENSSILNADLIHFLIENGEIIRAYLISSKINKEISNTFCEIFKTIIYANNANDTFSDAIKIIEKEKNKWCSNENVYPLVFRLLGCLFQVENLYLFSAATFILIDQTQKFNAVLISDENTKNKIEMYLNENPDGTCVKEIRAALDEMSK